MSIEFERMWDQVEHELGFNDHNMQRDRPYNGQNHTDTGERGRQEIKGITMRDLRDCFIRAVLLSTGGEYFQTDSPALKARLKVLHEEASKGPDAVLCENDLFGFDLNRLDPIAISQNLTCEVERIMGIFPNVPSLRAADPQASAQDQEVKG